MRCNNARKIQVFRPRRTLFLFIQSNYRRYYMYINTSTPLTDSDRVQGGSKKWSHRLMTKILSNLNRFQKNFTGRFLGKFVVKWTL